MKLKQKEDEMMLKLRMKPIPIDHRATHKVFTNGCVKLPYKEYIISIGADGYDVCVETKMGITLWQEEVYGDAVKGILACVAKIDENQGEYS